MRKGTHRTLLLALIICFAATLPAFAEEDATDLGTLYMAGSVATGTGVDIPEEATSIGNLVIEYSLDSSSWTYTSLADVVIDNLGQEPGTLFMRASYYGNEPEDYYCAVAFKSDGWTVVDGSGRIDAYNLDSSSADAVLPISFSDLDIEYSEVTFASSSDVFSSRESAASGISVLPGSGEDSFSIYVPVQKPINGTLVATLQASWPAGELPSGDYEADIQVEVSANT